jgi:hypothetical protein
MLYSPEKAQHFGGTYCLHPQDRRVSQQETSRSTQKAELSLLQASASFLLGFLFDTDGGGDVFLQNIGLSPNYVALPQP